VRSIDRLAELLDLVDIDGLATLFTKATVRTHGSEQELRGADAVKQLIQGSVHLYEGIPSTKHVVTNIIVEIGDDRRSATARSYWTAFQARPELPLQPILAGRWHDGLERGDDGWHIVERVIYVDLVGDVRFHIKGSGDDTAVHIQSAQICRSVRPQWPGSAVGGRGIARERRHGILTPRRAPLILDVRKP
jgi:SnoaL-like domain